MGNDYNGENRDLKFFQGSKARLYQFSRP